MKDIDEIFARRAVDVPALRAYGFVPNGRGHIYSCDVLGGDFTLSVKVSAQGHVSAAVTDAATHEDYLLHRVASASGPFVGQLRKAYELKLTDIAEKCFVADVFQSPQAKAVIRYVKDRYQSELEFLWPRFPDNAIFRRADNQKWFGALLVVENKKLGLSDGGSGDIMDVKMRPEDIAALVDHRTYFPGFHMNKAHWVTVRLNDAVPTPELFQRIDDSYRLSEK
jgi:predicted DNA-binding protein (MmcQ/YjbR family)